jgi:hypothetical protein
MLTKPDRAGPAVSSNVVMEASALASPDTRVFEMAEVERLKVNPLGSREKEAEAFAEAPFRPLHELQLELPGRLGEDGGPDGLQRELTVMDAPQMGNKNGVKKRKIKRSDGMRGCCTFLAGFSLHQMGSGSPR